MQMGQERLPSRGGQPPTGTGAGLWLAWGQLGQGGEGRGKEATEDMPLATGWMSDQAWGRTGSGVPIRLVKMEPFFGH